MKLRAPSTSPAASGLPTGKRQHKPITFTGPTEKAPPAAPFDTFSAAPVRPAAAGQATGKRTHLLARPRVYDAD